MSWIDDYQRWLSESESLQNAQLVVNHFIGSDWSKESISAMLGNMRHESSINPDMYEMGYSWSDDRGYGLVQWTPRSKYWDWAVANGLEPRNGNSQLSRINYEVDHNIQYYPTTDYPETFSQFRSNAFNKSVDYLTEAFTWNYERPNRQAGLDSMSSRKAFANRCFNELDWTGTGSGGSKPFFPTTLGLPITSPYGWRTHPITGETAFHYGIDIGGGGENHPIYATQNGVVTANYLMGSLTTSGGWTIRIRHTSDPYHSQYMHLAEQSSIPVGTTVTKGQVIGTMGTTGGSTGIHLDFGIATHENGWFTESGTIDPEIYLDMLFGGDGDGGKTANKTDTLIHLLLSDALNGWKI